MRFFLSIMALIMAGILVSGCLEGRKVVQGTVLRFEVDSKTLVLKEESSPNDEIVLLTDGAEIGSDFSPGDVLRVAYKSTSGQNIATRIMRVSTSQ